MSSAHFLCALTVLPVDLTLGDDDLAGVAVVCVADGVTQDADDSDHLPHFFGAIYNVAGVADQLLALGHLCCGKQSRGMGLIPEGLFWLTFESNTLKAKTLTSPSDLTPTTFPFSTTISSMGLFSIYVPP